MVVLALLFQPWRSLPSLFLFSEPARSPKRTSFLRLGKESSCPWFVFPTPFYVGFIAPLPVNGWFSCFPRSWENTSARPQLSSNSFFVLEGSSLAHLFKIRGYRDPSRVLANSLRRYGCLDRAYFVNSRFNVCSSRMPLQLHLSKTLLPKLCCHNSLLRSAPMDLIRADVVTEQTVVPWA